MRKVKRGIALLLTLSICLTIVLPYMRTVLASDELAGNGSQGESDYTVTIEGTEHGQVSFIETEEKTMVGHKGETITLKVQPDEGFQLGKLLITDGENREKMTDARQTEDGLFSFVMPSYSLVISTEFGKIEQEGAEGRKTDDEENGNKNIGLESSQTEAHAFPTDGFVWGKDSERIELGIDAILTTGPMTRSAVGSAVTIRPGTSHSYGSWSTYEYNITTSSGQFLGYCAQPMLASPNGTYTVSELNHDLIKAALLIAPGGVSEMYNNYGRNIYNEADNNVYAYAHALIGYLYSGSLQGLSASMADGVKNMAAVLSQLSQNPLDPSYSVFQSYMSQYKVYIAYCGSSSVQNIVWLEKNPVGYAKLKKSSSNTGITGGNSCYSLEGAQYGVYKDNGCSQLIETLITDANGDSNTVSLDQGKYYVKEIQAPHGYVLDENVYPMQVTAAQTETLRVSDEPTKALAEIELQKIDQETGMALSQGAASLENAKFCVNFYDGYYTRDNLPEAATRTWILRTRSVKSQDGSVRYIAELDDRYKESGDEFYSVGGSRILPLGTISIEEIQAPPGYLLEGVCIQASNGTEQTEGMYVAQVLQDGEQVIVRSGNEYAVADRVIRGDFELTKIDENTQRPMEGVRFKITSNTTGESHTFTTDANGHYSSRSDYAAHSYRTNGGNAGDGLWFGLTADGNNVPVDDAAGALPYDTYTVEELECDANKGKNLYSGTISVTKDNYLIDMGNIENVDVGIQTTAKDEATGTRYAMADSDVTIIDTVTYMGLRKDEEYCLVGTLMNRSTGNPIVDEEGDPVTVTKRFAPKDSDGEIEVEIFFDASGLKGTDIVVFEELYLGEKKIAEHTDMNDASQTIHFPAIFTSAADYETDCELAKADEEITIVDTVSYENLRAGRKYTVTGVLMDQETGKAALDYEGNKIEAETTFTAKSSNGTVEVVFRFKGGNLGGRTLVAFEALEHDNHEYALHKDLKDKAQTIYIPRIGTSALDADTKVHMSCADEEITIIDEVEYENLLPGREYSIKGMLINRRTGKAAVDAKGEKITAQASFVPDKKEGSVKMVFKFDGVNLAGETLVAYEDLLYQGRSIAEHKELEDEEQTIYLPSIVTKAVDKVSGEQISYADKSVTIEDVVSYEHLIRGQRYTVKGVLKNPVTGENIQDADGKEIRSETEFMARRDHGDVTVTFEFDGSHLAGKSVVVCEELFVNEKCVAVHEELNDSKQTIRFPEIATEAVDQKTGIHVSKAEKEMVITDTISYRHLLVNRQYHLKGTLMDQNTGKPVLDADGDEVHAEISFVPEKPDGIVKMEFRFNGKELENHTLAVFEELSMEKSWFQKVTIAVHKDLKDEAQSVHIPKISTTAIDSETKVHVSKADDEVTIIDTVEYQNLVAGIQYEVRGILMNKETGKPILDDYGQEATVAVCFIPEMADGTIEILFKFSGISFAGQTVVVYEDLYYNQVHVASHRDIEDEKQTVYIPKIATKALDSETWDHASMADSEVKIVDTITYKNLIKGQKYQIKGVLINRETGERAVDADGKEITSEQSFTADKTNGTVKVTFTFNGTGMNPSTLVSYEELFMNQFSVAEHTDLEDENQSIHIPQLVTKIVDSDAKLNLSEADDKIHAIDTVRMKNLLIGRKYVMEGSFLNQDGQAVVDAEGNEIHTRMEFTAESENVSKELEFLFDGSHLAGQTLLASVKLYMIRGDGTLVLVAEDDINNEDEHLHLPKICTTALDAETLEHIAKADEEVTITDMLTYENLLPGYQYEVKGVLMNHETGEQMKDADGNNIEASVTFTAGDTEGVVEVIFRFNGKNAEGTTLVAYEEVYLNGIRIANHVDIEDEEQSIRFPLLKTTAVNKGDGEKNIVSKGMVTITDKVEYTKLIPGREYKIAGTVMDKTTNEPLRVNGDMVTTESRFTAESSSGCTEVEYTFCADGMGDRELVVFEKLYLIDVETESETEGVTADGVESVTEDGADSEIEIAEHEDLEDKDQTVSLKEPSKETYIETVKTGDQGLRQIGIYMCFFVAALIIIIITFRGKGGRMSG